MNERERAERLARAIDDLLKGDHRLEAANTQPAGLEAEEITALLRIAKVRLDAASAAAHASIQYEGAIWQQVLHRLDRRAKKAPDRPVVAAGLTHITNEWPSAVNQVDDELAEVEDVARLRRQMSEEAARLAEAHRGAVWEQLQSRLQAHSERQGLLSFLRGSHNFTQAVPDFFLRNSPPSMSPQSRGERRVWNHFAAIGAAVAILVAALGPIPATGLAGHPAAQFVHLVTNHIGVTESGPPPSNFVAATTIEGTAATATQARAQLGVSVAEPARPPQGFELTSSRLFAGSTSIADDVMFVLTYASKGAESASLAIYQQRATGGDFAAVSGPAFNVSLGDGTSATYVEGIWEPLNGGLVWTDGSGQSLIFERSGVRASIQYIGVKRDPAFLITIADSLISR